MEKMTWFVYRDCDAAFKVRKVVVELYEGNDLIDRRRMFAGPLFAKRLKLKQKLMVRLAKKMLAACNQVFE